MDGLKNGWTDRHMDGWKDGGIDIWRDRQIVEQTYRQ